MLNNKDINKLPSDVILHILSYLSTPELVAINRVSKLWYYICNLLWVEYIKQEFSILPINNTNLGLFYNQSSIKLNNEKELFISYQLTKALQKKINYICDDSYKAFCLAYAKECVFLAPSMAAFINKYESLKAQVSTNLPDYNEEIKDLLKDEFKIANELYNKLLNQPQLLDENVLKEILSELCILDTDIHIGNFFNKHTTLAATIDKSSLFMSAVKHFNLNAIKKLIENGFDIKAVLNARRFIYDFNEIDISAFDISIILIIENIADLCRIGPLVNIQLNEVPNLPIFKKVTEILNYFLTLNVNFDQVYDNPKHTAESDIPAKTKSIRELLQTIIDNNSWPTDDEDGQDIDLSQLSESEKIKYEAHVEFSNACYKQLKEIVISIVNQQKENINIKQYSLK